MFYVFKLESIKEPQGVLDQLNSLLNSFENLLTFAKAMQFPNEEIRRITMTGMYFLYYSKIIWPVHANIWTEMQAELRRVHDDARFYFEKHETLSIETISYLTLQKA